MFNPQATLNVMDADMDSLVKRILIVDEILSYWARKPIEEHESEEFYAMRNTMALCVTALNKILSNQVRAISCNIYFLKRELKSNDVADNLVHLVSDEHGGEVKSDDTEN